MTTSTAPGQTVPTRSLRWTISDALVVTKRNLLKYVRVPTLLIFSTVQPVMFVLLFNYVFGGAIGGNALGDLAYINFLMPGIFAQTSVFGSTQTGVALADDMNKGLIDRFRSLPMARSAVLAGRTASDAVRNLFVILLMTAVGYLIGFRFQAGFLKAVAAVLVLLAFGYAFSWISAFIGLTLKDVETAQAASFVWVFPLVFASSAFVPTATMPGWLQAFANNNPVTVTVNSVRWLVLGDALPPGAVGQSLAWNLTRAIFWTVLILAIFIPLAVSRYRKAV